MPTFQEVIAAAKREDWAFVDEHLRKFNADVEAFGSMVNALDDPDGNLRDLAVSFLGITKMPIQPETRAKIGTLMLNDPNPYVRYRSAFALAERGDRSDEARAVLEEASKDKDVAEIAQGYLDQLVKE